jgi:acyl carrier protein
MGSAHEAEIFEIIVKEARTERSKLSREATLVTLQIDSLDTISVVFAIEEAFGITIDQSEVSREQTLGQVLDLVEAKIAAKATQA